MPVATEATIDDLLGIKPDRASAQNIDSLLGVTPYHLTEEAVSARRAVTEKKAAERRQIVRPHFEAQAEEAQRRSETINEAYKAFSQTGPGGIQKIRASTGGSFGGAPMDRILLMDLGLGGMTHEDVARTEAEFHASPGDAKRMKILSDLYDRTHFKREQAAKEPSGPVARTGKAILATQEPLRLGIGEAGAALLSGEGVGKAYEKFGQGLVRGSYRAREAMPGLNAYAPKAWEVPAGPAGKAQTQRYEAEETFDERLSVAIEKTTGSPLLGKIGAFGANVAADPGTWAMSGLGAFRMIRNGIGVRRLAAAKLLRQSKNVAREEAKVAMRAEAERIGREAAEAEAQLNELMRQKGMPPSTAEGEAAFREASITPEMEAGLAQRRAVEAAQAEEAALRPFEMRHGTGSGAPQTMEQIMEQARPLEPVVPQTAAQKYGPMQPTTAAPKPESFAPGRMALTGEQLSEQQIAYGVRVEKAKQTLGSVLKRLHTDTGGSLDIDMFLDSAAKIAGKVKDAGVWAKEMVQVFGERIRPYLAEVWEGVKDFASDAISKPIQAVKGAYQGTLEGVARITESGPGRKLARSGEFQETLAQARKVESESRRMGNQWENAFNASMSKLSPTEKHWLDSGKGSAALRGGGQATTPKLQQMLETTRGLTREAGQFAQETVGTKLRSDFGHTVRYTDDVMDAMMRQKGPLWDEIVKVGNAQGVDMKAFAREHADIISTRRFGALEQRRALDLPATLTYRDAGGKVKTIKTFNQKLSDVIPDYLHRTAERGNVAKLANEIRARRGIPMGEGDDIQTIMQELGQGMGTKESKSFADVLETVQGAPAKTELRITPTSRAGRAGMGAVKGIEDIYSTTLLSGSGVTNIAASWPTIIGEAARIGGLKQVHKTLLSYARHTLPGRSFAAQVAQDVGVFSKRFSTSGSYLSGYMSKLPREALDKLGGLGFGNKIANETSADIFADILDDIVKEAKAGKRARFDGLMRDYNITKKDAARLLSESTIPHDIHYNLFDRFVNKVNPMRPSALDLSRMSKDPLVRRLFPYMSYVNAAGNIAADIARLAKTNPAKGAALGGTFLAALMGGQMTSDEAKDGLLRLFGKDPDEKDIEEKLTKAAIGLPMGPAVAIGKDIGYSIATGRPYDIGPPTLQQALRDIRGLIEDEGLAGTKKTFVGKLLSEEE